MRKKIFAVLFALLAFGVILAAFFPMANSLYHTYPPLGDDFYHTFSQVKFFQDNFTWPQLSWKYIWHFGGPSLIDYPWLNYYPIVLLANKLGLYPGVMLYFLAVIFLYGWVSYLLFRKLSNTPLVSLGLAVALVWSSSTWHLLFKSAYATATNQLFLATAIYLIVKYKASGKRKYLYLSAVIVGLSFLIHGTAVPFLWPAALILLIFWWEEKEKFWQWKKKIIDFFSYIAVVLLTCSYYFYMLLTGFGPARYDTSVFDWMRKDAFAALYNKTNIMIVILCLFFLALVLILRKLKGIKKVLPFLAVLLYLILFNLVTLSGHNPVGTDFPPHKGWYIYTLMTACLCALFWGGLRPVLQQNFRKWLFIIIEIFFLLLLFAPFGFFRLEQYYDYYKNKNEEYSCAPGESLHQAIIKNDYTAINSFVPAWFPKDEKNSRYLAFNSCIYLYWSAVYKMPLQTGYALILRNKNNLHHVDRLNQIFRGALAKDNPKFSPATLKNNALFYIDWMGAGYIENIESDLVNDKSIIDFSKDKGNYNILAFNKEITSPVIRPTNVPAVLVVSAKDGYETILEVLAQENLNSRFIIPIRGSPYIEDLAKEDLNSYEAVLLYDYRYKNGNSFKKYPDAPWKILAEYVKGGGKLFIETGSEVKESDIKNLPMAELPEVFPVKKTTFGSLGSAWELTSEDNDFLTGVSLKDFSPLMYENSPWKLSYALPENMKKDANILLSQEGKPILASSTLGKGKVYWSGLTLPYHIKNYSNIEESRLFKKILEDLIGLKEEKVLNFDFSRAHSEKAEVTGDNPACFLKKILTPAGKPRLMAKR
jgi:hypothetical protein